MGIWKDTKLLNPFKVHDYNIERKEENHKEDVEPPFKDRKAMGNGVYCP